jgi:hypothetical protein
MVRNASPELSAMCTRSDHGQCPHWASVRMRRPWRRRLEAELVVCRCPCHADCPLSVDRAVLREVWAATCTCPGAAAPRASFERRREMSRFVGEVDFTDHPDAEEIETRLRAVFEENGEAPPPGMTTWSRLIAAGSGPRGTRLPRVLAMGGQAIAHAVRWSHEPALSGQDAHSREQMRSAYRAIGAVVGVAMALTVAAVASTGWRRVLWSLVATVAWLTSGYSVTLVTAVASIARSTEAHARAQDLPSR